MGVIVRLQKYIAMCGTASRRGAEALISDGKVTVNGKEIKPANKMYYIMVNKPSGYVSTVKDQFERPTVIDLLGNEINARVFPVGRLDYETEGLLLMTNDGDFTYKVTHPKHKINKTYIAVFKGGISIMGLAQLRKGVRLDDVFVTSPAEVEMLNADNGHTTIKITIHEGKNRQVRRMFEAVGSKVIELQRISIGNVELGNLPLGRWRYLTSHEISYLKNS